MAQYACGKRAYNTRSDAQKAKKRHMRLFKRIYTSYLCRDCRFWHLTAQDRSERYYRTIMKRSREEVE